MSSQQKKVESPRSERTVKVQDGVEGEALAFCSEKEWEQSESAYSADLLNVKKKPNRVTVFAAPEKTVDSTGRSVRQVPVEKELPAEQQETDERVRGLARLVAGFAKMLLDEDSADVEVTVSVKMNRSKKEEQL